MAVGVLGNAISGLLGAQAALSTTSHNISNVSTDGYTRQNVVFGARNPVFSGGNFFGSGTQVDDVRRIFDKITNQEVINNTSTYNQFDIFSELAGQIDGFLADPSAGASPAIQSFFDSINGLSNDPSSVGQREVVFNQVQILSTRFNNLSSQLDAIANRTESEIGGIARQISTISSSLAEMNRNIVAVSSFGAPNDLLDKRDQLLNQLSQLIDISTFEPGDKISVSGISKGKGFQGVVKRHGFHGGPRTHGQMHSEREPGSIGSTGPQRVFMGVRMAGRMGSDRVSVRNLTVLRVDAEKGELFVSGAVPGRRGILIEVVQK